MERVLQSGYQATDISQDVLSGGQGHAASRILEAETVEDLSVRRRAREVGVTPADFYNHYPTLNDLLLEIGAKAIRRVVRSYIDLATRCTFAPIREANMYCGPMRSRAVIRG